MGVPTGLSGASAIALVRSYANEPTIPVDTDVLMMLNRGVEEVVRRIGGIRLWGQYYTENQQTNVVLNDDILDIVSANFSSSGSPLTQGALVYPMMQLEQGAFMDAAAGFPAVGFGPPQAYFIYQDSGQASSNALPVPSAPTLSTVTGTSAGTKIEVVTTYTNANGETPQSAVADLTPTTVQQVSVATPKSVSNATGYNIYAGAAGGPYYLQNTSGAIALGTSYTIPNPIVSSGTQPPSSNTATGVGQGGALTMQLYPSAMVGQVNVYYRARPLLWADTGTSSYTNLDSSAQEAVVLFTTMRVLQHRGRPGEAVQIWKPEYEAMIADLHESINRRTQAKSSQVRDVRDRSYPSAPWWMTS